MCVGTAERGSRVVIRNGRTDDGEEGERERHVSANSISFLAQDTARRGDPKSPDDDHADADLEPRMEPNHALGQRWGGKGECTGVSKQQTLFPLALGGVVTYLDSTQQYFTTWSAYAALTHLVREG